MVLVSLTFPCVFPGCCLSTGGGEEAEADEANHGDDEQEEAKGGVISK